MGGICDAAGCEMDDVLAEGWVEVGVDDCCDGLV